MRWVVFFLRVLKVGILTIFCNQFWSTTGQSTIVKRSRARRLWCHTGNDAIAFTMGWTETRCKLSVILGWHWRKKIGRKCLWAVNCSNLPDKEVEIILQRILFHNDKLLEAKRRQKNYNFTNWTEVERSTRLGSLGLSKAKGEPTQQYCTCSSLFTLDS